MAKDQKIQYVSVDVTDAKAAQQATEQAELLAGRPIDYVFTCAGASKPGLFLEQDVADFEQGMKLNYFGTLYTLKVRVLTRESMYRSKAHFASLSCWPILHVEHCK